MAKKFVSLITEKGKTLIAAAIAGGDSIKLKYFAVGDGNGAPVSLTSDQTALVNEVARVEINSLKETDATRQIVTAEAIIPAATGGFWMREAGVFTEDGTLLAVSQMPETYKPDADDGATSTQIVRMLLAVSDTSVVNLTVDDSTVTATEDYVNSQLEAHEKSRNHPDGTLKDKGFVQLSSATDSDSETLAATSKAVKAASDNADSRLPVSPDALSVDLNTLGHYSHRGVYYQSVDVSATAALNYPIQQSGTLLVTPSAYGCQQEYTTFSTGRKFIRGLNNTWNGTDGPWDAWAEYYGANHKPTATDVGAYPVTGGEVKGEVWSGVANNYRIIAGQFGSFWRFDGSNHYLMFTSAGDQHGGYNDLRPLSANSETGDLSTGHNFTASGRVTAGNNVYSGSGNSWLATDGNVYGACWGGYLNNWITSQINAGQASRVASVGLGARVQISNLNSAGDWSGQIPIGAVLIAALTVGDDRITSCYYSYLMYNINGNWVNAGQVG